MNEIITASIPTAVTALITYFLTRRKYLVDVKKAKAEAKGNEIDNVEKAVKIWRELTEDLKVHFKTDISDLRADNKLMHSQLEQVLKENNSLRQQMASLEKELKESKNENIKLSEQLKQFNQNYHNRELKTKNK